MLLRPTTGNTRRLRRTTRATLAVLLASPLVVLAACTSSAGRPADNALAFLNAFAGGRPSQAAAMTDAPRAARASIAAERAGLGAAARADFDVTTMKSGDRNATVSFVAHWSIPAADRPWSYTGHVSLVHKGSRWLVHWTPSAVNPALRPGTRLGVRRTQPTRAPLLDSRNRALFRPTQVVTVGLEPRLIHDLPGLAAELAAVPALEETSGEIRSAVRHAAAPTDFVPLITLRRTVYEGIRAQIHSLPGTVFQSGTEDLTRSASFGQPLLGRVGPASAAIAAASHGAIVAGDEAGDGGLQEAYNRTLSGTPGVQVGIVDDRSGEMTKVLATLARPQAGSAVHLTISTRDQQAAEDALADVAKPAAVVAVQPSTGKILADADSAVATYDLGLDGALPPGSTFKIATWLAAFTHEPALTPATLVPCPATTTVDGRVFVNENRFSHPPIPVAASFGYSCNTSAILQTMHMPESALGAAAHRLGVGAKWSLPVPAYSGSVPPPAGQTERAADSIGQGRVLTSPLAMALMAGAAVTGQVWQPTITETAPRRHSRPDLSPKLVTDLTALMRATVDMPGGTAHSLASFSGLMGKTGTAEYGNDTPPRTHTWFAGVRGDLAFAVFIYDGATHGGSALPVVARFLSGVAGTRSSTTPN